MPTSRSLNRRWRMASSSSRAAARIHAPAPAARSSSAVAGCAPVGPCTVIRGRAQRAVDVDVDVVVPQHVARRSCAAAASARRRQRRPGGPTSPPGPAARSRTSSSNRAPWRDGVDQSPVERLLALDALGPGGEDVGEVAPDVALVDHPGQAAGARAARRAAAPRGATPPTPGRRPAGSRRRPAPARSRRRRRCR